MKSWAMWEKTLMCMTCPRVLENSKKKNFISLKIFAAFAICRLVYIQCHLHFAICVILSHFNFPFLSKMFYFLGNVM